jgi:hypothetical protein
VRAEVRPPLPSVPILPDDHVPDPPVFPRDPNTVSESLSGLLEVGPVSEPRPETAPPPLVDFTPAPPAAPPPDLGAPPPPSSRALPSVAPASTNVAGLPSVKEALNMRVRVGEGAGPLWGFLLLGFGGAVILIAVFVFLFGVLAGSASGPDEAKPSGSAASNAKEKPAPTSEKGSAKSAPEPQPEPEPPPPEPMPKDAVERAARGDEKALADLEARPAGALSVTESLAVASGHAAIKRRTVQELGARARKEPAFASSDEIARELKRAAADPGTMSDALRVMAELPDPQGADMLYDVYMSKKKGDPTGDLARMLLFNDGVRKRASPALKVALDLRTLEKCDQVLASVKEAEAKGDKRSTSALFRFNQKKGCGDDKKADCWPCLRDGDELKDAIRAVAKRKPAR